MKDLLIEIGTEELPARVIKQASDAIKEKLSHILGRQDIKTYSTPRRLAFYVKDFENVSPKKEEIIWGPPVKVAYEGEKPTRALTAFLEKNSASLEDVVHLKKGEGLYVAIRKVIEEEKPLDKLQKSFEEVIQSVPLPKTMRWDGSNLRFSRPIRWLCALYGGEVVPLSLGKLRADRLTYGHRILSPDAVRIERPEEYKEILRERYVIVDYEERLNMVLTLLKDHARTLGGKPVYPEGLEEEVTNLVEAPFAVVGKFEEKYLELPDKVIMTVLAHHQRFFCIEKDGRLLPYFIGISNNRPANETIAKGYEKVIRARLEDALFFYREDLKNSLESLVPQLSEVLFHPKAGSMWEKVKRVRELSLKLAESLGLEEKREKIERASYLCKADLLTHMVRELDELQGYMGYVYALKQGEDPEVALALYEHYLPVRPSDPLPTGQVSAVLSLADKLDSLYTLLSVGELPTGSSDPYGMRRLAHGLFAVIDAFGWNIDIRTLCENITQDLEEFFRVRLESYLSAYPQDIVRAVLEVKDPLRPYEVISLVKRLATLRDEEKFKKLVETYKRVVKILPSGWEEEMVEERFFKQEEERRLWTTLKALEGAQDPAELASFKEPVDLFFDSVLVMDSVEEVRRNRLALLLRVKKAFNRFADFSKIVI